jgi:hypothetical protein
MPGAPRFPCRLESFKTFGKPVSGRIQIANRMLDVPEHKLSMHD